MPVYGNDHYLFHSAIFWLSIPICFCLPLAPRYIAKAYKFSYDPTDIDLMRWIRKTDPSRRTREELLGALPSTKPTPRTLAAMNTSGVSVNDPRQGSRTDMATGVRMVHRGFDFATEENGVAMQRMQTNLSERRRSVLQNSSSQVQLPESGKSKHSKRGNSRHLFSLPRSLRRKKSPLSDP